MENEINLDSLSVQELKAMAYDVLGNLEHLQKNLQLINQTITKKQENKTLEEITE